MEIVNYEIPCYVIFFIVAANESLSSFSFHHAQMCYCHQLAWHIFMEMILVLFKVEFIFVLWPMDDL